MGALEGDSTEAATPGLKGTNSTAGNGVYGTSAGSDAVVGLANALGKAGVLGLAPIGNAVAGISDPVNGNGTGVFGQGKLFGGSFTSPQVGVLANSTTGNAVNGTSAQSDAVVGTADAQGKAGVLGLAPNGNAVAGISDPVNGNGTGVFGQGKLFGGSFTSPQVGVLANSTTGNAVNGTSAQSDAVVGTADAQGKAGVLGLADNGNAVAGISKNATGIYGQGGKYAGYFDGIVLVTGDIQLTGGDLAEQFDVLGRVSCDPGTVMVIDNSGALIPSHQEYDRRVAGVVAGAGDLRPGIVLDGQTGTDRRRPIALVGKVCCKAIADGAAIAVGDLLTSSGVAGHAMKASDPSRAFGAVIGKALQPLPSGAGLIHILIALQ